MARIVADRVGDGPAEAAGGEDDPGAGQGQPLPGLRRAAEVVAEGVERHDQRAGGAVRPEPGVDRVERARADRVPPSALRTRRTTSVKNCSFGDRLGAALGPAVGLVEEDQVEVAVIVQLAAAELAEADDRPPRALAVGGPPRGAVPARPGARHWSRATWTTIASATSASSRVTSRIGSRPRMSRVPIRTHSLFRKLSRIGARSSAPLQSSASSALIADGRLRPVDDERVHQVVDHARVVDQDLGEELAGRAELDVKPQASAG